jgi:soluble lytic murein transglycosylase
VRDPAERTVKARAFAPPPLLAAPLLAALTLLVALPPAAGAAGEIRVSRADDGTLVLTNEPGHGSGTVERPPRRRAPSLDLLPLIERYAQARGLDPVLVQAVIQAESAYDPRAVSRKGAIGLMQLMPETARELGVDPWDPEQNVRGGTLYLRRLIDAFEGDVRLALAGYNAGPGAVKRYGGIPPYSETTTYVSRVLGLYHGRPVSVSPVATTRTAGAASTGAGPVLRRVRVGRDANGQRVFSTPE